MSDKCYKNTYVCYDEHKNAILNYVDTYFKNIALELGAVEYHIPALIDKEVIEKCGYFSTFPQHLTSVAYMKQEEQEQISQSNSILNHQLCSCNMYLTPAACLHIYPMLEKSHIDSKIITTRARVYRYENSEFDSLTRLWDFTVREIVFIGTKEYVIEKLELMKQHTIEFARTININAEIKEACDNFYPSKHNLIKMKLQRNNSMKYECLAKLKEKDVAISSFNYHGTHFSKTFNFDRSGNIVTGCVGYGLERWVSVMSNSEAKNGNA